MTSQRECNKCDDNRHDEYCEPCMQCHTFREKLHGLQVVERLDDEIKWFVNHHKYDSDWSSMAVLKLLRSINQFDKK